MKLIFDILTIVLFFILYKLQGIYSAVATVMVLYTVQAAVMYILNKKIDKIQLISLALILSLGGATFLFHNELFFKWKPTAIYTLFSIIFLGSQFFSQKTAIEHLLDHSIKLSKNTWHKLNTAWAVFFAAMAGLNLFVAYHFDTDTWVNFKLFGVLGLTFGFVVLQSIYLAQHHEAQEISKND